MCSSLTLALQVFYNQNLLVVTPQNKYFKVEVCLFRTCLSNHGITESYVETIT